MVNRTIPNRRKYTPRQQHAHAAYANARRLGKLNAKRPAGFLGEDRFPVLAQGQVYATRAGAVFHPTPCGVVRASFELDRRNVVVILAQSVGGRRGCRLCKEPTP